MSHLCTLSIAIGLAVVRIALSILFPDQDMASPLGPVGSHDLFKATSPLAVTRQIEIGAFMGVSPPTATAVNEFEDLIDRHISSVMWYQGWDATGQPSFPCSDLLPVLSHDGFRTNLSFHLTWEPWVNLADIANGVYDSYLARYATEVKQCGLKTRLRFAHEMIQDDNYNNCQGQPNCPEWYPWQDRPTDYVAAFRHVHDAFKTAGATNVEFAWCPNNYPSQLNVVSKYYPGPEYVDWLCIDGYKWNGDAWGSNWFNDIFYNTYHTFIDNKAVFGDKPVMIGESAACEGPVKPAWIADAFTNLASTGYSKVGAFYWFNINKECDWRVNSSSASLTAFQTAMNDTQFTSHSKPVYLPVILNRE